MSDSAWAVSSSATLPHAAVSGAAVPGFARMCEAREWTDAEILARIAQCEEAAWAELLRRYRGLIYRCIAKVTTKHAPDLPAIEFDEIYANVVMSLFRDDAHKLRVYDPSRGTKLGSWLGMLAINASHDYLRGMGRRPMLDRVDGNFDQCEEVDRTPLDNLLEKERWEHLNSMLQTFSDKDRTFLDLYYGQGMDAVGVAGEMDISVKTVYSKKNKIRHHLRTTVERAGSDCVIADLAA